MVRAMPRTDDYHRLYVVGMTVVAVRLKGLRLLGVTGDTVSHAIPLHYYCLGPHQVGQVGAKFQTVIGFK